MSWSATTATQSDIRTCFGAIEDERFYSFLYEGTATPQENQRIETRHAGASKQAFCARLPQIFTLCSYKIDVFLRIFSWTPQSSLPPQDWCFVPGFRQFSSHVTKCHACNGICTLSSLDAALTMRYAKNTYHDTTKLLRLPCQMMMEVSKAAPATKNGSHLLKATQSIVPVTQKNFWHVMKHVLESHKVPRLPYETKLRKVWSLQSTSGCDRLRTQK